jgi:hypothetical protein
MQFDQLKWREFITLLRRIGLDVLVGAVVILTGDRALLASL